MTHLNIREMSDADLSRAIRETEDEIESLGPRLIRRIDCELERLERERDRRQTEANNEIEITTTSQAV